MGRKVMIACVLAFGIILTVAAQDKKEFKIPYEKYMLSNGLNVILHVDRSDPIAAVYVVYHVGSAREEKGRTGFAHLFEHLRFNESQDIPQGQWFRLLQTAGASMINGSTNTDRTNYFEVVPKNAVEMALWMESDRMGFLLSKFTQETFVTQQNVVQNEKRQYDNNPYSQTSYIMDKLMYPESHPYNWQVIGSLEDLANASIDDAVKFHDKYYGPSNATLVVAGDIDVEQTKAWIEKYFAEIASSDQPKSLSPIPVTLDAIKRASYEDNLANAPQLTISFPTVEEFNKDAYALNFLARIFGGTKKSPLYKIIVEEKKLAPSVSAYSNSSELAGTFELMIRAFPSTKLGDVEAAVKEACARFEKEGFTDQDVERQKAGLEYRFYSSITSVLGKSMRLADYNIFRGTPDYIATDMQNSMKVTKEDVWRVYNTYIKGKPYIALSTVPKGKMDLATPDAPAFIIPEESIDKQGTKRAVTGTYKPEPIASKIDRTKKPVPGSDPAVTVPPIWTDKTVNGIPVYGIRQSELPLVQFTILVKGGMLLDSPSKIGTAYLTARLMNEGTKSKTPVELREAIDDLGASLSFSGGDEWITLSGSCLASKLPETFALAKEMLFEPRWDEKEFGIAKNQTIENLKRMEASPASIAGTVFGKLVYGPDNILANQAMGTPKSIEAMTIDDLKAYYDQYFSAKEVKVAVVGDVEKMQAISVFNALKDWNAKAVTIPAVPALASAKAGIYFIDVPKAKQSVFSVGHSGLAIPDPDYYKAVVMNHKLGGDFSSILNMILRETKSFTYGARSSFDGSSTAGTFRVSVPVQSNATYETAQIIRDEIAKFRQGITSDDLNQVKSVLLKSNAGRFETLGQLGRMLMPVVQYGLPFDYVRKQEDIVRNMTVDEHRALAQKYLQPDKMIYVIVGDKATQFDKLKELGLGEPIQLDKEAKPAAN
jgi:zinc protease